MIARGWSNLLTVLHAVSIRGKIMGLGVGLVLLLGIGAILQSRAALIGTVGTELDKRGVSLARDVAARIADPLLTRDHLQVYQILRDTLANNSDVRYVFVQDGTGRVVAHTFVGGFPTDLLNSDDSLLDSDLSVRILDTDEGRIREAVSPVVTTDIGTVHTGMSEAGLYRAVVRVERNLLAAIVLIALLGTAFAWYLTGLLTEPVLKLVQISRAASAGDLTGRAEVRFDDEIGELVRAFNQMLESMADSRQSLETHARLRTELLQKLMTVQEDERKRIARELHDDTGQAITGLMVGLKLLEQAAGDPEEVRVRSAELRVFAARTLESVRQLSRQLRPSVLDDAGLVPALRRHVFDFARHHGLAVDFQVVGDESRRLPSEVETAAYRIVQEALTNVSRHAGARSASIVLDLRGEAVATVVEDDGIGFDPTRLGEASGVLGMRERATLLGGSLTIESRPGAGTTVFAKLPTGGAIPSAHRDCG